MPTWYNSVCRPEVLDQVVLINVFICSILTFYALKYFDKILLQLLFFVKIVIFNRFNDNDYIHIEIKKTILL